MVQHYSRISQTDGRNMSFFANSITSPVTNGLVAWWKFNEGSGLTAYDSSSKNFNLTVNNTGFWTSSGVSSSNSYYCNYNNNFNSAYCWIPISMNTFGITTQGSISMWVYPLGTNASCIWGDWNGNGAFGRLELNGTITMASYPNNDRISTPASSFSFNTWQHITFQWEVTKLNVYLNGVLQAGSVPLTAPLGTGANFGIGARARDTSQPTNTIIDNVRIYNRFLSVGEILTLYHSDKV